MCRHAVGMSLGPLHTTRALAGQFVCKVATGGHFEKSLDAEARLAQE